jgi:hypothetical protein
MVWDRSENVYRMQGEDECWKRNRLPRRPVARQKSDRERIQRPGGNLPKSTRPRAVGPPHPVSRPSLRARSKTNGTARVAIPLSDIPSRGARSSDVASGRPKKRSPCASTLGTRTRDLTGARLREHCAHRNDFLPLGRDPSLYTTRNDVDIRGGAYGCRATLNVTPRLCTSSIHRSEFCTSPPSPPLSAC